MNSSSMDLPTGSRASRPARLYRAAISASALLLLFHLGAPGLAAQSGPDASDTGRLLGRVIEGATGEPIPRAHVRIESGPSTLSDLNGRFIFSALPAGSTDITVQALGYASKTVTGVAIAAGDLTTLDITLESQAIELDGIRSTQDHPSRSYRRSRMWVRRTDTGETGMLPLMDTLLEMEGGWRFMNFVDDVSPPAGGSGSS